jgi:hypothetical protein
MNTDGKASPQRNQSTDPWVVLQADAKNYLTLAAGLIGVTATFADRLVSGDPMGRMFLFAAWACLAIAIGAAAFASGGAFNGVAREARNYLKVCGRLNATVFFIGLGVSLLALAAWRTSIEKAEPTASGVEVAREVVVEMTDAPLEQVTVKSFILDDLEKVYVLEWLDSKGGSQVFDVRIDSSSLQVVEVAGRP